MKLTPLDIRHKEFRRGMRGYADVEVDEFLDQVADEYERIFKENIDLQERLEALEDKVAGYKRIEETLQKTLVNAQASAEEQKQNATKQAQLILQDAELKARQLVNDAYSERQAIEQGIAKLRNAEEDFRFKFKTMLEGYMRQLQDAAAPAPEADPRADFARQAEAIKLAIARESASPEPEHETDEPLRAAPFAGAEEASGVAPDPTETTMSQSPRPAAEEPEAAAQEPVAAAARASVDGDDVPAEPEEARDRIVFGESDDLLADVDTGVNENEFKW